METSVTITTMDTATTTAPTIDAGYRLVQYWTPDRNYRKEAVHKFKVKKYNCNSVFLLCTRPRNTENYSAITSCILLESR